MAGFECRYCGAVNDAEERRCVRCGRRLHNSAPRPAPDSYALASASWTATAAAPVLEKLPGQAQAPRNRPSAPRPGLKLVEPREQRPYQTSLFREPAQLRPVDAQQIAPIPMLEPLPPAVREAPRLATRTVPAQRRNSGRNSQQALDLQPEPAASASAQPESIYCDAPIAPRVLRAMAAAADLSIVLLSLVLFLGVFFFCGGKMALNRSTLPFLACVGAVIALLYRSLYCLANSDTPGMRFAHLKLLDFDGRRPNREQRGFRQIAAILSVISVGLGLVWAMVDEETLTWHDRISKTFTTIA